MANLLAPVAKAKFFDNNGRPAAGYQLFTYEAGTSTKLATYTDETTGTPNSNPVILDYRGEANVWLPPNVAYKFIFAPLNDTDPPTAPIWSVDDIVDSQLVTLWGGVDTGIANAYVLNFVANFTTYVEGIVIYWLPANSNTGASTINVNGLGPVAITNQDGSTLTAGQIQAGQIATIVYLGTGFVLLTSLSVISTGTFSLSFTTGFGAPLSGDISYTRFGSIVTLTRSNNLTGTSNSVAMQAAGAIPAFLRPSGNVTSLTGNLVDNNITGKLGSVSINPSGDVEFALFIAGNVFSSSGFTASSTKGLFSGWQVTYTI